MKYIIQLLCATIFFVSCNHKKQETKNNLIRMKSEHVYLNLKDFRCLKDGVDTIVEDSYRRCLKYVVFIDSTECTTCVWNSLYKWNDIVSETTKKRSDVDFLFIMQPSSDKKDRLYMAMRKRISLESPIYVDTAGIFIRKNFFIPQDKRYHSFLLDHDNKIILVGDILLNEKLRNLFYMVIASYGKTYKQQEMYSRHT